MNIVRTITLSVMSLLLLGCGNEHALPEYNGVYARYSDGTLIKLDGYNTSTTAWLDFKGSISLGTIAKARSHLRNYVTEQPKVKLDMSRVNAFIIKGGEKKQHGFPKWLIGHYVAAKDAEGKPFEKSGSGTKENMFLQTAACGTADGMLYKEEAPDTFVFKYPVEESGDYKYCELSADKPNSQSDSIWYPKTKSISFYGIWHDGMVYTFAI